MAASVLKAESSSMIIHAGWSKEELTDEKVSKLFISKFKEIATSYESRSANQDLKSGGPWYPIQYSTVLQKLNQHKRLNFLMKNNAFYHGYPPEEFTHLANAQNLGGKEPCAYQIKPDCEPVRGLNNALAGRVSLIDCSEAVQLAMYAALQEILGDEKFNQKFSGKGQSPLFLHPDIKETPLFTLGLVKEVESHETPELGDCVYFSNIPDYVPRHSNGDARGYHAICVGSDQEGKERKYVAFGTPSEGITKDEMYDILIQEFNKPPIDLFSILSNDLAKELTDQTKAFRTCLLKYNKLDVVNLELDREGFQRVIEATKRGARLSLKAGLAPLFRHFDINGIKALL